MQADDKIIERVRKLLAMANDASSPNEAAIAARRARSLMDKYQLGLSDLAEKSEFGTTTAGGVYKATPLWQSTLAVSVAKFNDCQAQYKSVGFGRKQIEFRGLEVDVVLASYLYVYLMDTAERLCKQFMINVVHNRGAASNSYKRGFSAEMNTRLAEIAKEREVVGTGLMVIKNQLVADHFGHVSYSKSSGRVSDQGGYNQGKEDARKVHIGPNLNQTKRTAIC